MTKAEQRRRWRVDARHARRKKLLAADPGTTTCPVRFCGGTLETTTDTLGRTVVTCAQCDRKERGICRDCPRPVEGRVGCALRCREHKAAAIRRSIRAYEDRNPKKVKQADRAHYNRPEVRAHRIDYKRNYRKVNRHKTRAQKRRAALRQSKSTLKYQAKRRKKFRAYNAWVMRERWRRAHPPKPLPPCTKCRGPIEPVGVGRPTVCDDCLWPYQRVRRWELRTHAAIRDVEFDLMVAGMKVPKGRARYLENGDRLCLGADNTCTTAVHGRTKKCEPCKTRERDAALAALAAGSFAEVA